MKHWVLTIEGKLLLLEMYMRYYVEFRIKERYTEIFDYQQNKYLQARDATEAMIRGVAAAFDEKGYYAKEPMLTVTVERVLTFSEYKMQFLTTAPDFPGLQEALNKIINGDKGNGNKVV